MKIDFTRAELHALRLAASEVMEHPESTQVFPNAHTRAAAFRAYEKLAIALRGRRRMERTASGKGRE